MKYCKKCKRLNFTEDTLCTCGKKLIEDVKSDVPCELICADESDAVQIASSLNKADVPFSDVLTDKVQMMFGSVSGKHTFYVPLCFYKKSIDTLASANNIEIPDYYDKILVSDDTQWEELPPLKRNIVRILSVIVFAVLVYLCVAGVDMAALFIKGLFR